MRLTRLALVLSLVAMPALADFSYKSETKVTGGAMAGAIRMGMKMSKGARDAMNGATYVKGGKVATQAGDSIMVMDVDAETVTEIDHGKRQYSTMTFAEYQQAIEAMAAKVKKKKDGDVKYSVNIKDGAKSQSVSGYPANLTIMALAVEASDGKGNSGAMEMVNDLWLAKGIAGASELNAVNKRFAEKLAGAAGRSLGAIGAMIQQQGGTSAMQEFQAKASLMEGVPVLTVIRMAPAGSSDRLMADAGKIPVEKADDGGDAPSMGSILRGMGGFGGGGKAKPSNDNDGGSATLIEMSLRNFDFSNGPVNDSVFQVPSGYKQVDSDLKKALR